MASSSRQSLFSYPLTRHYPWLWFDWGAGLILLVFAVIFTFVALAADGYVLEAIYVSDLNSTLEETYWFQHPPISWMAPVVTTCQSAQLTPGGTYFTSNQGLTYTVVRMWTNSDDESTPNLSFVPSTPYSNTSLANCNVQEIVIDFARSSYAQNTNDWWSWDDTSAEAYIICSVISETGTIQVQFSTGLPSLPAVGGVNIQMLEAVLSLNFEERPAMWFGAQLTAVWYHLLAPAMGWNVADNSQGWDSGTVILYPNPTAADYMSENFFLFSASFSQETGGQFSMNFSEAIADWPYLPPSNLPNIGPQVDAFAKSFYSLILTDFSVMTDSNAMATPAGIQYLLGRTINENPEAVEPPTSEGGVAGLAVIQSILANNNGLRDDGLVYNLPSAWQEAIQDAGHVPDLADVKASTIFAQYLCSVPRIKKGINLVVSIVIADLVFLQVVWNILNWVAQFWLGRRDSEMNDCESCRRNARSRASSPARNKASSHRSRIDASKLPHASP